MSKPTTRSMGESGEAHVKRRRRDTIVEKNKTILMGTFISSDESTPTLERGVRITPDEQVQRGKFCDQNGQPQLTRGTILYPDESVATGEFVDKTLQKGTFVNEFGRIISGTFSENTDSSGHPRLEEGFTAWTNGSFEIGTFATTGRSDHRCFREGLFLTKKTDGYILQVGSFRDGQCCGVTLDLRSYMKRPHEDVSESVNTSNTNDSDR